MDKNKHAKAYKTGHLPSPAPLALAYVPRQESVDPNYEANEALSRGTLFPGLDLPFMNIVNKNLPVNPMTEMMSIAFVVDELELYLDTHCDDREAFDMYQRFLHLKKEAHRRYVELCGPIKQSDMLGMDCYSWIDDPWPWDYQPKLEV